MSDSDVRLITWKQVYQGICKTICFESIRTKKCSQEYCRIWKMLDAVPVKDQVSGYKWGVKHTLDTLIKNLCDRREKLLKEYGDIK